MNKFLAKRKIKTLVATYAVMVKRDYGIVVDQKTEINRVYADYLIDMITIQDIENETAFLC